MKTIDYYNQYADEFAQATLHVNMDSLYQPFLAEVSEGARILDVGCGAGRDTLAFKNKGHEVDAIDYSEELVKRATQLTGVQVKLRSFYEIEEHEVYDGIQERSTYAIGKIQITIMRLKRSLAHEYSQLPQTNVESSRYKKSLHK